MKYKVSKKLALLVSIVFILTASIGGVTPVQAATSVYVNANARYQTLDGWGGCIGWWGNSVGGWSDTNRNAIMDLLYGSNGLALNIVKYNIGGGENPNCSYGNHMRECGKMDGFEPSAGVWDWSKDANQRWALSAAISRGANKTVAWSDTPPWWMTISGCAAGATDKGNNLQSSQYSAFADYLTEVVKHFRDSWGITFNALEPINEPMSGFWHAGGNQEGCGFSRDVQRTIYSYVASSLSTKGLTATKLEASDETNIDQAIDTWNSFDSTTRGYISTITSHAYSGSNRTGLNGVAAHENKPLWMTEFTTGYTAHNHTDMKTGQDLGWSIVHDIKDMGAKAWLDWDPVESEYENLKSPAGQGNWGLIHGVYNTQTYNGTNLVKEQYWVTKQYYVMKQFSAFMKQGYTIIDIDDANSIAAVDPTGTKLVIVQQNYDTANNKSFTYDLSSFNSVGTTVTRYRTSPTENCVALSSISTSGKSFTDTAIANSVTTYVVDASGTSGVGTFDPTKYYKIVNQNSQKALEDNGWNLKNGAIVDQWDYVNADNMHWQIVSVGGGNYKIINRYTKKAIEVPGYSTTNGTKVDQWDYVNQTNEQWQIVSVGSGIYKIINKSSGKALEIPGYSTTNGTQADQWDYLNQTNEQWQIVAVN